MNTAPIVLPVQYSVSERLIPGQDHVRFSKEGRLAETGSISYLTAFRRAAFRKAHFASARPLSAVLLGYGNTYKYEHGVLCYSRGDIIRILDVHDLSQTEIVVDVRKLLLSPLIDGYYTEDPDEDWIREHLIDDDYPFALEIMQCQNGMLSFLVVNKCSSALIMVDVRTSIPSTKATRTRVRCVLQQAYPGNILRQRQDRLGMRVLQTSKIMYYAHVVQGERHLEWTMYSNILDDKITGDFVSLRDLFGTWPFKSIVFKMHEGYMYILSNQSELALSSSRSDESIEEVDGNSYYLCYRFPLDDRRNTPDSEVPLEVEFVRVWRRRPRAERQLINDGTDKVDLILHEDETTGTLVIVEDRKDLEDWSYRFNPFGDGGAYEFQPFKFSSDHLEKPENFVAETPSAVRICAQQGIRLRIETFGESDRLPSQPGHKYSGLSPWVMKHRTYNPSCDSFLGIIFDVPEDALHQQMHIRIGTRKRVSPVVETTGHVSSRLQQEAMEAHTDQYQEQFKDCDAQVWPPLNAPTALLNLLNPFPDRDCNLRAESDERSIIYMIGPKEGEWIPKQFPRKVEVGDEVSDGGDDGPSLRLEVYDNFFEHGSLVSIGGTLGEGNIPQERVRYQYDSEETEKPQSANDNNIGSSTAMIPNASDSALRTLVAPEEIVPCPNEGDLEREVSIHCATQRGGNVTNTNLRARTEPCYRSEYTESGAYLCTVSGFTVTGGGNVSLNCDDELSPRHHLNEKTEEHAAPGEIETNDSVMVNVTQPLIGEASEEASLAQGSAALPSNIENRHQVFVAGDITIIGKNVYRSCKSNNGSRADDQEPIGRCREDGTLELFENKKISPNPLDRPKEENDTRSDTSKETLLRDYEPDEGPIHREDHAIILINFDAGIHFPGLEKMDLKMDSDGNAEPRDDLGKIVETLAEVEEGEKKLKGKEKAVDEGNMGVDLPWFREERASWMDVGKGFRFEYE